MPADYWNHNVHHHGFVLAAIPGGAKTALDIGCGDGLLARKLAGRLESVVGVDVSPEMIALARELAGQPVDLASSAGAARASAPATPLLTFAEADFLKETHGFLAEGEYDFITAVAVVHHVDFAEAVTAIKRLLAPGGRLVVIGLAADRTPLDFAYTLVSAVAHRILIRRKSGFADPPNMPMKDNTMTMSQVRRASRALLPGSRFQRRLLWRYSLVWDKPAAH